MDTNWTPRPEVSVEETSILKLCKKQKLWDFLRRHQHVILDDELRAELRRMFAEEGPGRPPVAPEILTLAMLLQVGFGVADHEVPTLTAVDARWQMVLGCLGRTEPVFSQGTVFHFRERARKHGLMLRLLDKTVAVARATGGFDHKRLRALIDSSPLIGAGRVEDTFNLLGRAMSELVDVAAVEAGRDPSELAKELDVSVALGSSVKAVLDVDWRDKGARAQALQILLAQFERVQKWLTQQFDPEALAQPPLADSLATVLKVLKQDTDPPPEPDGPDGPGEPERGPDVRDGTAKERLISLSDRDMRHGRKSKTKVFSGYKRHIVADADVVGLVTAVMVLPANRPEHEAAKPLLEHVAERFDVVQLHIDRGYLSADAIVELHDRGVEVVSKPPHQPGGERFGKSAFSIDFDARTMTCPGGVTTQIPSTDVVQFRAGTCHGCTLRDRCITAANKRGRQVRLHPQERWYREMSAELATPTGRAKRRERTAVEHRLARIGAIQTTRARYRGLAKNQTHLEVVGAVSNCYLLAALLADAA